MVEVETKEKAILAAAEGSRVYRGTYFVLRRQAEEATPGEAIMSLAEKWAFTAHYDYPVGVAREWEIYLTINGG